MNASLSYKTNAKKHVWRFTKKKCHVQIVEYWNILKRTFCYVPLNHNVAVHSRILLWLAALTLIATSFQELMPRRVK